MAYVILHVVASTLMHIPFKISRSKRGVVHSYALTTREYTLYRTRINKVPTLISVLFSNVVNFSFRILGY